MMLMIAYKQINKYKGSTYEERTINKPYQADDGEEESSRIDGYMKYIPPF